MERRQLLGHFPAALAVAATVPVTALFQEPRPPIPRLPRMNDVITIDSLRELARYEIWQERYGKR